MEATLFGADDNVVAGGLATAGVIELRASDSKSI